MESRCEIQYEIYIKTINIEALTTIDIASRQILPAVVNYKADLASSIGAILSIDGNADSEKALFDKISDASKSLNSHLAKLDKATKAAANLHGDVRAQAVAYRDNVFTAMAEVRKDADLLETLVAADYWPFPTYTQLLFNV
jgi:glutamine synthetase